MKGITLAAVVLAALTMTTAWAEDIAPAPVTPAPGSPGTATPTPYPQVTPRTTPKPGESLPSIELPSPPKDQTLPGLEPHEKADKSKPGSA